MSEDRTGQFRLQRQHAGIGYFGQVRVRLARRPGEPVEWRVAADDTSSLQPDPDGEFVAAARAGAADGLALVAQVGVDLAGVVVEVVHAQVDITDIEVSAVRAAAALAVADAFGVADRMRLAFTDGWTVSLAD